MAVITIREALKQALREEMLRDERVFLMGEDIGPYGGSFAVTKGLYEEFGEERVVPLPTDLSDRTQVRHSLREFSRIAGGIDVMVENTGALVNRGLANLRARGITNHETGTWHQELLASTAGVGRNLRAALHELKARTASPIVTVTPATAETVQYLVSAVSGPLN